MTFNVESEFLGLFVHGFKRAESLDRCRVELGLATTAMGGHILQISPVQSQGRDRAKYGNEANGGMSASEGSTWFPVCHSRT